MKKVLFVFITLLLVGCGSKVTQPEPTEEDNLNLPKYRLVSIDEPYVSSNGSIPRGENLVYNIEIERAYQKDSLELLQNYFIRKGKVDFIGINKVIVRVYLKGTLIHGTPYASLDLIGAKKNIIINEDAKKIKGLIEDSPKETVKEILDPLVGTYFCDRTHDTYVFKADKTGIFTIQGGGPSTFTWKRSGGNVTISYEVFGEQKLKFDQRTKTITENSESFGTLVFNKQ